MSIKGSIYITMMIFFLLIVAMSLDTRFSWLVSCDVRHTTSCESWFDYTFFMWLISLLRVGLWSILIFILPGYWLSLYFFSEWQITWVERITISIPISISVSAIMIFYISFFEFQNRQLISYLWIAFLIMCAWLLLALKNRRTKQ